MIQLYNLFDNYLERFSIMKGRQHLDIIISLSICIAIKQESFNADSVLLIVRLVTRVWLWAPTGESFIDALIIMDKGESYLDPMQPPVHSAECTRNCAWWLNEELPIAAKFWTNKVWIKKICIYDRCVSKKYLFQQKIFINKRFVSTKDLLSKDLYLQTFVSTKYFLSTIDLYLQMMCI